MPAPAEKKSIDDRPVELEEESRHDEKKDDADHGKRSAKEKDDQQNGKVDKAKIDQALAPLREALQASEPSSQKPQEQKVRGLDLKKTSPHNGVEVLKTGEDKYLINGITSFDKVSLQKVFNEHGINVDLVFPGDWGTRSEISQRQWLREQGITVVTPLRGGEVNDFLADLPDEGAVSGDLGNYIREIKRIATGARSSQDKNSALQNIEQELTTAKLRGGLAASEDSISQVQEALSKGINDIGVEAMRDSRGAGYLEDELGRVPMFEKDQLEINAKEATDKLLSFAKEGRATGAEWDEALKNVKEMVQQVKDLAGAPEPKNYGQAHNITKGIRDAIARNIDGFDKLPDETIRNELKSAEIHLKTLDHKFQALLNSKNKQEPHALVGDIDSDAALYLKQITAGYGVGIDRAKRSIWQRAQGEDPQGIREWRALRSIESLDESIRVQQLTETPVIWREVPDKLASVYTQMESMDFTVEELQVVTSQAIQLVRSVTPDDPEGRELRDKLVDQLEAFRGFHSMRITMERNDMDPERMLEIFKQYFDDETWQHFAERFAKDSRSREFLVLKKDEHGDFLDNKGNVTKDENAAARENINVFDVAFSQYSERLRQERIKMNMVEELTKHAIENPLGAGAVSEIEKGMRIRLSIEQKADLENLRQYFVRKTQEKINETQELKGRSVDEVWGRKREINGVECLRGFYGITHQIVQDWSAKETLQGAFGNVSEKDLKDLMLHFGMDPSNKDDFEKARGEFLNKDFLQIRRGEMLQELEKELNEQDVRVDLKDGTTRKLDLVDLMQSGFLESVDSNAYYTTWMFEWSNYDGIRIYSRDTVSNLDDDFESLVFHQNTNMFYGRHIDHIWEFYHDTNENRGRPKENDVNRIWKQYLPGKHHYLFPQNSTMVRWTEHFMNAEQKATLQRRTEEMMRQYDFDNEKYHEDYVGWMRNAAMMDMIESGEVSMSAADNNVKFSEIMKQGKVRKFEMIDVFVDRNKHKEYAGPQAFQAYLANPTNERFIELNDKTKTFYSTRGARQFPFMTLAFRAHWDVNSKHRRRLFDTDNLTSVAAEHTAETLQSRGDMERKQVEHEKRKLLGFKSMKVGGAMGVPKVGEFETPGAFGAMLGTTPFRRLRQGLEFGRKSAWEAKHVPLVLPLFAVFGFIWGGFTEFLKQGVNQASGRQR
ncbi:hypothetical protein A3J17_01195 [Candidatus Curtissbacteria bacterium RIFCSPLOWO2_02_FULL_40_11]|uniref:Uncharacterized protein n=1 Tax=Candidatus Curtissbacteria bacterium RIFCSPHIGHO2_02_FULL_40_16b TaxID=1797714 RepID=A0A1F5GAS5_9BACT|nr:MAG: hypothetical protein A3D04_01395 [Candidatus Curtissbacteria bacterium RIFCSPHIGHO2_02_FULL_40_16b]OGD99410.1 MAG: hypothetical protein A3J17_01195 [Candidatus Curtissbacteria bacterium RIFCSPLOWO2_02_FULL_40_11]